MKKIIYSIIALAAVFTIDSCKVPEEKPIPEDNTPIFEIDDLEALPAEAGTFSVVVTTNVEFTVEIPDDITWLRYVETKAEAPEVIASLATKKEVVFAIELNEVDEMRQARVKFLDTAGEQLKALTIIQKSGGGIEFEVVKPDDVAVTGGTITLEVTSNVPYEATPEVDWITVKNVTATATELEIASNGTVEPRDGKVNFFREGTDKLIGEVTIHQMEPNIVLTTPEGSTGFDNIVLANLTYLALESGPAEIVLAKGTHKGDFAAHSAGVPLTITGNGVATLDGTIEIDGASVTVKDLTIAPSEEGNLPVFDTDYKNQHGIFVHRAGYGVRIENVSIDMSKLDADATGIFLLNEGDKGTQIDVIKNCVVDGGSAGHRLMQAYGAKVNITGSTFKNPYSSYAVRFGNKGGQILLASNIFEGTAACAVHFNSLEESTITLGNGTKDNNKFNGNFESNYKASTDVNAAAASNTFAPPVEYAGGNVSVVIDPNAPASLERVWGYYNGPSGEWDDEILAPSTNENWNRNGIISGDYVYVTIAGGKEGKYGVAVFDLLTGEYIRTITTGFTKEGTFWTCGIVKLEDGGSDVIYVSNLAMTNDSKTEDLVVYRLIEPDSEGVPTAAEVALRYTVPAGERYGDKMTCFGSNEDGILFFVSYYNDKQLHTYRQSVEFQVADGSIVEAPFKLSTALADGQLSPGNLIGGIYMFIGGMWRHAIYGTNFSNVYKFAYGLDPGSVAWYNCLTDQNSSWGEDPGSELTNVGYYDANCIDPRMFEINSIRYLAYTVVELDANAHSSGYLRLVRCPDAAGKCAYPLFNALYAVKDDASAFQRYPLGDPDDFNAVGHEGTNKTGYCDVAYRGDDVYVLAGITSTGMSVFKVE